MRRLVLATVIAASAGVLAASPVAAQHPANAVFSTIDLTKCKVLRRHADGNSWECRGHRGIPVYLAEGDLRTFVSAGRDASKRRAASQTLAPFNSPFPGRARRFTIEWRIEPSGGTAQPFAMIYRLHTSNDTAKGQVLVVMRIGSSESCQVATIDALANENALALARDVADGRGRGFDCKSPPQVVGKTGRSPM